jgi:hypothetical protein
MEPAEIVPGLLGYAERLHALAGGEHHVVSPLGAWMLVALCAPLAAEERAGRELAEILGVSPAQAAAFAARLLAEPHPMVAAGAGVWLRPGLETERFKSWLGRLPGVVDTGDIPSQEEADRWAARRTLGLITQFPLNVGAAVFCLLATALATKVCWEVPFDVVDAAELGRHQWARLPRRVLRAPRGDPRHRQFLARTARAGPVAVHLAQARGGLLVGSVIAADHTVPPGDVLAAAHQIVTAEAAQPGSVDRLSLFGLPLGDGPVWSVTEEHAAAGPAEQVACVLPAWAAETSLGLLGDPALGFPAIAQGILAALNLGPHPYQASQAAIARSTAVGFEAAAVTALVFPVAAFLPGRRRTATVRFAHPYAVVAAVSGGPQGSQAGPVPAAWHGLPVFSAWVAEPAEAAS